MSDILFPSNFNNNLDLPFMLYSLGMNHPQESVRRPDGLPVYQWIQCLNGRGCVHIQSREYLIHPGQGMFIKPGIPHMYQSVEHQEQWMVSFVCFNGYGIEKLLKNTPLNTSDVFDLGEASQAMDILKKIYNMEPLPPAFAGAKYSAIIYEFLLFLTLHTSRPSDTPRFGQSQRISPVISYIEEHYRGPIYLDDIAGLCGLSKEYLCQLFKSATGMSIFDYVQQTRVKHSKELLLGMPDLPAHTIGSLCGFNSSSYFNKIFKKIEHISPGDFRRQNGIVRNH